jgi:hypothetical protein
VVNGPLLHPANVVRPIPFGGVDDEEDGPWMIASLLPGLSSPDYKETLHSSKMLSFYHHQLSFASLFISLTSTIHPPSP